MRTDPNPAAQPPSESSRANNPNPASGYAGAVLSNPFGEDQASLSGAQAEVRVLAAQVLQFPEIRQEKVSALRQVVLDGKYKPSSSQIAGAVLAHMLAIPAA